jgi:hypothetical protein
MSDEPEARPGKARVKFAPNDWDTGELAIAEDFRKALDALEEATRAAQEAADDYQGKLGAAIASDAVEWFLDHILVSFGFEDHRVTVRLSDDMSFGEAEGVWFLSEFFDSELDSQITLSKENWAAIAAEFDALAKRCRANIAAAPTDEELR